MKPGKLITLEGVEGAGKSTALAFIKRYLEEANVNLITTREPGGTPYAEKIRHLLLHANADERVLPETELLLMFAGRAQHIAQCIRPALKSGKWVLSDRYIDASYAYQGGGRGVPVSFIEALDKQVVNDLYPTLTFLLDLPVEIGMARAEQRQAGKDRIEQEKIEFFERVRQAYLLRAKVDPKRMVVIDASQTLPEVEMQLQRSLDKFLMTQLNGKS